MHAGFSHGSFGKAALPNDKPAFEGCVCQVPSSDQIVKFYMTLKIKNIIIGKNTRHKIIK
jgi:hypothetical protein